MHVLVMAKSPVPGKVKTRLCPPLTQKEAAAIAEAALADTLDAVAATGADRRIIALEGEPGPWLPSGFEVIRQRGDGFDQRLANAWDDAGEGGIQIGMDTPHVTAAALDAAMAALAADPRGSVIGYALDGGWWAIGLHAPNPAVFLGVPMSTDGTGAAQEARLRSLGLAVSRLDPQRDIDTIADLAAVAGEAPTTRTAMSARRLLAHLAISDWWIAPAGAVA